MAFYRPNDERSEWLQDHPIVATALRVLTLCLCIAGLFWCLRRGDLFLASLCGFLGVVVCLVTVVGYLRQRG